MHDVTFVMSKGNMGYYEVLKLPYHRFLSIRKNLWIIDMESTQEGQEFLAKQQRLMRKDADLGAIRSLSGYKSKKMGGEK